MKFFLIFLFSLLFQKAALLLLTFKMEKKNPLPNPLLVRWGSQRQAFNRSARPQGGLKLKVG